ncbi:T9SS type A sorting domain-containing protein [Aridibaculum aurantiacum]|uniref:T9SS type A sorting domain-containing protein n=1 Tax=Aridibaculum aurantiacum TaxID=2810307 RepID=UPI001A972089|nr:T9SS type A sorting domain-containing protein [Aridibaculum aurantiacum]
MRKIYALAVVAIVLVAAAYFLFPALKHTPTVLADENKKEKYDGPMERGLLEMLKTQDPALGRVPTERLWTAMLQTEEIKEQAAARRFSSLFWEERGPIFDSVGPSNGNTRGSVTSQPQQPGSFTSGRIRALLVDAADPTGNTVWTAGVAGGLWKTTNFLDPNPNWQIISDFFDNMAITSIAQDPSNLDVMYFSTGEATSNADAVWGRGVWKTTNHGISWQQLPSSTTFNRNFKIMCDGAGNVYLATRAFGLRRSNDGGSTWVDITPSNLSGITNSSFCTDIEFAGSRLLASFGYATANASNLAGIRYTDNPATATNTSWEIATGLPENSNRIEMTARGDTCYAAPSTTTNTVVATYRSFDGGANWTRNNPVNYPSPINIASSQAWYDLEIKISPVNPLEFLVGGLDAYRSVDGGLTVVRNTYWVGNPPYVHADHHTYNWMLIGGQLRVIMATDGGLFLSLDNGATYQDRNIGLGLKQFYSGAIHPLRTHYLLGGTQDNGSHQIKNPGKTYSIEVTGGDGAFVDIDQRNPNFQYTSYVYNQYRRSNNDGNTWSSFNLSNNRGYFINPFDYDDSLKIMYASFAISNAPNRSILRWNNPTTATNSTNSSRDTLVISSLSRGASASNASAFITSPYTHDRLFVGGSNGSLVRIDGASTATNADMNTRTTVLTGPSFSTGFINCIAIGSSDDELLAVFSNYGVTNLWYSSNGGTTWTGIDGNLPDMPVRWALFHPTEQNKLLIATETGVWTTEMINGASTEWTPSGNFPLVRTDMLKLRPSDNLILAATHGRGLWTTNLSTVLPLKDITLNGSLQSDGSSLLAWKAYGATNQTRYTIQFSKDGNSFTDVGVVASTVNEYKHRLNVPVGYYRIKGTEPNAAPVYSNVVSIRGGRGAGLQVRVLPNPITTSGNFMLNSAEGGNFNWNIIDAQGRVVQSGKGSVAAGSAVTVPLNMTQHGRGIYRLQIILGKETITQSFMKQ